jgi:hypothetical protein
VVRHVDALRQVACGHPFGHVQRRGDRTGDGTRQPQGGHGAGHQAHERGQQQRVACKSVSGLGLLPRGLCALAIELDQGQQVGRCLVEGLLCIALEQRTRLVVLVLARQAQHLVVLALVLTPAALEGSVQCALLIG